MRLLILSGLDAERIVFDMPHTFKQKLGALILDWPRFEWALRTNWLMVRNRNEHLHASREGRGFACQWQWTSDLHITGVFPALGRRLMMRAMQEWPITFADRPAQDAGDIQISFVIGHRGKERAPHLLATLATIAAQQGVRFECIVVEQSVQSEVRDFLPTWVRYLHTPISEPQMPYCRSWTLNAGAKIAKGKVLVLHDNDMLVPQAYASEIWARSLAGYEGINLKRFVFYLTEQHSRTVVSDFELGLADAPDAVVQNLEAGGSVAMTRSAFMALGGYDESFVGWGGEDNEFWERAQTRRFWHYAYLPIVHLWHPAQPRKQDPANPNSRRHVERSAIPPEQRIRELAARPFGDPERLSVDWPESRPA